MARFQGHINFLLRLVLSLSQNPNRGNLGFGYKWLDLKIKRTLSFLLHSTFIYFNPCFADFYCRLCCFKNIFFGNLYLYVCRMAEPIALHNPRARRLRSLVWNDFTKKQKADGNYEAICSHCSKKFTANSRSGTTHLRNHLNFCLSNRRTDVRRRGKKNLIALKSTRMNNFDIDGVGDSQFDQQVSRQDLSRMIILHNYPLEIVKHTGFQIFVGNLRHRFKMVSENMIMDDCVKIFENARNELYELLKMMPCRISLSIDRWGLIDRAEYFCVICHFVDNNWKLKKKMLNLLHFDSPSTADDVCEGIIEKLHDWNIGRKLSCICLDQFGIDQVAANKILVVSSCYRFSASKWQDVSF